MGAGLYMGSTLVAALAFAAAFALMDEGVLRIVAHGVRSLARHAPWPHGGAGAAKPAPWRKRERAANMVREMPAFLHVLNLGLSAGLSFDASLELYCKRFETPLAQALWDAQLQWRMGVCSRSEALEHMARELNVAALTRFASTVTEALSFGAPLAQTLEQQARVIAAEQQALVEAHIERAPVKMLIPLGTLIVPAMLLAILGPLLAPALGSSSL